MSGDEHFAIRFAVTRKDRSTFFQLKFTQSAVRFTHFYHLLSVSRKHTHALGPCIAPKKTETNSTTLTLRARNLFNLNHFQISFSFSESEKLWRMYLHYARIIYTLQWKNANAHTWKFIRWHCTHIPLYLINPCICDSPRAALSFHSPLLLHKE